MSNRDESFFDTGMTSAASRKVSQVRNKREESKLRAQTDLLPGADQLRTLCEVELASIYDVRTWALGAGMTDKQIREERRAKEMHEAFVKKFRSKVDSILRTPIRKQMEEEE